MKIAKKSMQGLSLIEVLVTVVILSLGILGTSALQITALKGTDSAHYRTVATFMANEMAERIRMNLAGVQLGAYETDPAVPITCNQLSSDTLNCNGDACTASQLATFDKTQVVCGHTRKTGTSWKSAKKSGVENTLPNGSLAISCGSVSCGSNVDHVITVSWNERADNSDLSVTANVILEISP